MGETKVQRMLKILCVVGIVFNAIAAVLTLGASAISIVGLNTPGVDLSSAVNGTVNGQALTTGQALGILGVMSLVAGIIYIFNIVACVFGLRGAKDPTKIKPFFNIVVVLTVLQVIAIVLNTINGNVGSNMFFSFFFDLILLFLASQIKQQA